MRHFLPLLAVLSLAALIAAQDKPKAVFVNSRFRKGGQAVAAKVLANYADVAPNCAVGGYVTSQPAPWDEDSEAIYQKPGDGYRGLISHARAVKMKGEHYALKVI